MERRWISLTSGRNPRSSIRTSVSTCFFRFNFKTKHVDFIHSFACQCHVYYKRLLLLQRKSVLPFWCLPFWCVFYVRQAIKIAARDLALHGIVNQSNRPSIINGVRFYVVVCFFLYCWNCRLSLFKLHFSFII
jgi:hypothetical protein